MGKSAPAPSSKTPIRPQFSPDALREYRKAAGLTQKQLADILWCRRPTVTDWEKGYTVPQPANLRALAEALGVRVADLLKETEAGELNYAQK